MVGEQLAREPALAALGLALDELLAKQLSLARLRDLYLLRPPIVGGEPGDVAGGLVAQPLEHRDGRAAILGVVPLDRPQVAGVARAEIALVLEHRVSASPHLGRAHEAGELLDLLEPVAFEADAHGLADRLREIDEDVTPQQLVELGLADRVEHAEPLEHADLDVPVVVDVHRRVIAQPLVDRIDHRRYERALLVLVVRPLRPVCPFATGPGKQSEHEREIAVGTPERIALEVDRQIEPRGLGNSLEPPTLLGRLHEPGGDRVARPRRRLQLGLLVQRRERPGTDVHRRAEDRVVGQRGERRDSRGLERHGLGAPDPRDVREVVAGAPLRVAVVAEPAHLAGRAGNGDRDRRHVDEALERALRAREVGVEIARPERLAATGAELDVHVLGRDLLHVPDARAVEAQLQHVRGPRLVARELRVHGLVAEFAERRRKLDPLEEVGVASPAAQLERRLVDHRCTGLHGAARARGHVRVAARLLDLRDLDSCATS